MESNEFWDAMDAYNEAFGEYFPTEECYGSREDMIALMREAVATGVEYDPRVPEGCVA
jgi:hypothetical protein